jgi:HlyD family secretion protein
MSKRRYQIGGAMLLVVAAGVAAAVLLRQPDLVEQWIERVRALASRPAPLLADGQVSGPDWLAAAPGKVEPVSGEVRVGALMLGRVAEVLVKVNDRVGEGDLLVRLEDDEARARLTSAETEVVGRKRDRDGVTVKGAAADRRLAEDAVAAAERALAAARREVDRLSSGGRVDQAREAEPANARQAVVAARDDLVRNRAELARTKAASDTAPGRLDTALGVARAQLAAAEAVFEKTRIRAPLAGTILQLPVRVGETVAPERTLVVVADMSGLRVRVDLDERHAGKVHVGQTALVRSEAFAARSFIGVVVAIAPALAPGQTATPGRRRPNEGNVLDVHVELPGASPLLPGMQVDVFFLAADGVW